jgi:hypothetical protein
MKKTTTRMKPRGSEDLDVVKLQPAEREISQMEIDGANRFMLFETARRLRGYAERESISKLKVTVEEFRPIKPVYPQTGGNHIGYVQEGPRRLVITVEDFEHDGHIRAAGEPW